MELKKADEKKIQNVLEKINKLEYYCEQYNDWPKYIKEPKTEQEILSKELNQWLYNSNYYSDKKEFRYPSITNEFGVRVKDIIDKLYNKHSIGKVSPYALKMLKLLREYCETYEEFPKYIKKPQNKKEILSNKLYSWLHLSNYNNKVSEIIEYYEAIYTRGNITRFSPAKSIMNIWQAKDSKNIGLSLYYLILELNKYIKENDQDMTKYYRDTIIVKLKNNNLYLNIEELLNILEQNSEEQIKYFYEEYTKYSIMNEDNLALLFKNLYNYSLTIEKGLSKG